MHLPEVKTQNHNAVLFAQNVKAKLKLQNLPIRSAHINGYFLYCWGKP